MTDIYFAQWIARTEHDLRNQSLAKASDDDFLTNNDEPGWMWQQVGRLLLVLGHSLSSLGAWVKHGQNRVLEARGGIGTEKDAAMS